MKTNDIFNSSPHESPLLDELIGNTGELTTLTAEQQIRMAALNMGIEWCIQPSDVGRIGENVTILVASKFEKYITTGETK